MGWQRGVEAAEGPVVAVEVEIAGTAIRIGRVVVAVAVAVGAAVVEVVEPEIQTRSSSPGFGRIQIDRMDLETGAEVVDHSGIRNQELVVERSAEVPGIPGFGRDLEVLVESNMGESMMGVGLEQAQERQLVQRRMELAWVGLVEELG